MQNFTKIIFTFLIVFFTYHHLWAVGSGRNLVFSSLSTNRINIPNSPNFILPNNSLSIETWVQPTQLILGAIFNKIETNGTREYDIMYQADGRIRFALFDNADVTYLTTSAAAVPLNSWTHIAATYSAATGLANIYINGVLDVSNNIGAINIATTNTNPIIGAYWLANNVTSRNHFSGNIDEVRFWNITRTQTQIRDNMCRTLVTPQAGLVAYYRLDETSGLIANDASGNGNNGTLQNFPVAQTNAWPYSGAPIGNASVYNYPANWAGLNLFLNSLAPGNDLGSMTIDNITGNPTGAHLYRVDAIPSQTGGLTNPIPTYFGIFVIDGVTPTYRATYNYSTTVLDGSICEINYTLRNRNNNSVANWTALANVLNTTTNTLIATNINSRREIILDPPCAIVLPVDFTSFDVTKNKSNNSIFISWSTTNETNVSHFEIQQSYNGIDFETIDKLSVSNTSNYEYSIPNTEIQNTSVYYRIKEVDNDGNPTYSVIRELNLLSDNEILLFPNPAKDYLEIISNEKFNLKLFDITGKEISNYTQVFIPNESTKLDISSLPSGVYTVKINSSLNTITRKFIREE